MKNVNVEITRFGASVQLVLRAGASSGQAIIVTSDDVEIHLGDLPPKITPKTESPSSANGGNATTLKALHRDLDVIFKRLLKLKPSKRVAAINSIKAMFQFDTPLTDDEAVEVLDALRRRGSLTIDASGRLQFHNA